MNLKDVMHFYLGCSIQRSGLHPEIYLITGVRKTESHADGYTVFVLDADNQEDAFPLDEYVKLLVRPLSSMTEEEKAHIGFDAYKVLRSSGKLPAFQEGKIWAATQTHYLIKQGFDLFGLIESGQAIDSTKI